jgi:hypothetical protein
LSQSGRICAFDRTVVLRQDLPLAAGLRGSRLAEPALPATRDDPGNIVPTNRTFKDFMGTTLDSWSRPRGSVAKAEYTLGTPNPRFVAASIKSIEAKAHPLYEESYCARGEMDPGGACPP